jgi:CRISPR/Cas system-associated exonuclease Cas4 (RecB family)
VSEDHQRFVNASELNDFLYCRRAWAFRRAGAASAREPERQAGTAYHVQHGEKVATGERTGMLSRALLVIGAVLLLLGLLAAVL